MTDPWRFLAIAIIFLCSLRVRAELPRCPAKTVRGVCALVPRNGPVEASKRLASPTNIEVTLQPNGSVTLSWDAINAAASSGAFYNIYRKLPGQTAFVGIGGTPGATTQSRRMSFTDATIPTSAAGSGAQYIMQGQRGTLVGDACDAVVVQFGVDGGGGMVISNTTNAKLKMAA